MNKPKLKKVEKLTNQKYVNLFLATFALPGGKEIEYEFASRKSKVDILSKTKTADAVRILPYFYEGGQLKVVLIREYRYPVDTYLYGIPAGLVEEGESYESAARREVQEEIGATIIKLVQTEPKSYTSAGLSDESVVCYEAEVALNGQQHLDDNEDIAYKAYTLGEVERLLESEEFEMQGRLQLRCFLALKGEIYPSNIENRKNCRCHL